MTKGFLVDIEGADGSGKGTQAKMLTRRLEKEGVKTWLYSFPRYNTPIGHLIGEFLVGKHGDFMTATPYLSSLPYALDRADAKRELESILKKNGIVICDRYTNSNAHQMAKLPKDEQKDFFRFIENLEYNILGLPKPSLVVYLFMPTDVSANLVKKKDKRGYIKAGKRDNAERNIAHQDRTRQAYLTLARDRKWVVINCAPDGVLRSRDDIHEELYTVVTKKLGL